MRLTNKVAIITGGGSGFGEGMAKRFAQEGAKVVVADINVEGGKRVVEAIRKAGGTAAFQKADVARDAQVKAMVGAALKRYGRLDIVVNNAGFTHRNQPMTGVSEKEFDRIFAVNVKAIFLAARHAVPVMKKQGGGVILNTASTAGVRPRPGLTWYNASKGAAITATRSMAVELAPDKIRVVAINPVVSATGMLAQFLGKDTPEIRAKFVATIPMGRMSTPKDIANTALFLCSDEAEFLTGICVEVDGGRCI
ncbi:MAG: glucose 1-dehydrogenase [Alphaproteobacteria bacterium]|nr:glucose 1-dehydrogenase [Alphaproteobacteria bacterium]